LFRVSSQNSLAAVGIAALDGIIADGVTALAGIYALAGVTSVGNVTAVTGSCLSQRLACCCRRT